MTNEIDPRNAAIPRVEELQLIPLSEVFGVINFVRDGSDVPFEIREMEVRWNADSEWHVSGPNGRNGMTVEPSYVQPIRRIILDAHVKYTVDRIAKR